MSEALQCQHNSCTKSQDSTDSFQISFNVSWMSGSLTIAGVSWYNTEWWMVLECWVWGVYIRRESQYRGTEGRCYSLCIIIARELITASVLEPLRHSHYTGRDEMIDSVSPDASCPLSSFSTTAAQSHSCRGESWGGDKTGHIPSPAACTPDSTSRNTHSDIQQPSTLISGEKERRILFK